jgi:hypothetical protein
LGSSSQGMTMGKHGKKMPKVAMSP